MAHRFRGEFTNKVDQKGRVSIPASFRPVIEAADPDWASGKQANLIIVYGLNEDCLDCYTMSAANEIDEQIDAMEVGSEEQDLLTTIFHTESHQMSIDETGRLVLPARLREQLGNPTEAHFTGIGKTFQIWDKAKYAAVKEARKAALRARLPSGGNPLSLLAGKRLRSAEDD